MALVNLAVILIQIELLCFCTPASSWFVHKDLSVYGCGCFHGYVVFNCWVVLCILPGFCNFIFQLLQSLCLIGYIVPSGSMGNSFLCSFLTGLVEILYLPVQGLFFVIDTGCILVCEIWKAFPICLLIVPLWESFCCLWFVMQIQSDENWSMVTSSKLTQNRSICFSAHIFSSKSKIRFCRGQPSSREESRWVIRII